MLVPLGVLVHRDADLQARGDQVAVLLVQRADDLLQAGQGGLPGEFEQQVVLDTGDRHGRADRAAALADHRADADRATDDHTDGALGVDLSVGEEPHRVPALEGVGQAADQREVPEDLVRALDEAVGGEAVGVGEQDGHPVVGAALGEADDDEPVLGAQAVQREGGQPGSVEGGGPRADRRRHLDPLPRPDHPGRAAADHRGARGQAHRAPAGAGHFLRVVTADEETDQVRWPAQPAQGLAHRRLGRRDQVGVHGETIGEATCQQCHPSRLPSCPKPSRPE
nr:hypothetical protein GCM10020093_062290 [Planobispora longispora]